MKHLTVFIAEMLLIIGLSIFASRSAILNKIDLAYLEDLYAHSQWSMPLSTRIMADGDLYQVAGDRLIKGASAFSINPEMPPVGKYLYGLGIAWWHNPYLISTGLYLTAILLFSAVSFKFLPNRQLSKIAILLFSLSPIVVSQISQTALDLPQLVFLLAHVLTILSLNQTKRPSNYFILLGLSGVFLGLFAASKMPILVLPILLVDFLYFKKSKRIISVVLLALVTGIIYLASYTPTLLTQKMSLVDWLKNQLWMINFYKISKVENNPSYYLSAIFLGRFKGWWENSAWQQVQEWTILWLISILATIKLGFNNFFKKPTSNEISYAVNLSMAFLFTWLLMPFWSRYFLLAIPFLIIGLVKLFADQQRLLSGLTIISLIWFLFYLLPNPKLLMDTVEEKFNASNYQDFYHFLVTDVDRAKFYSTLKELELNTLSESVSLKFTNRPKLNPWIKEAKLDVQIEYKTPIGSYKRHCQMPIIIKQNQWRLIWNWQCLAPNFQSDDELKTLVFYAQQGSLIAADGTILSQWGEDDFILVDTQQMKNDDVQLKPALAALFKLKVAEIEKKLYIDYRGSNQAPLGFVPRDSSPAIIGQLKMNGAVSFIAKPARIYHPQLSVDDLNLVKAIERQYPELFGQDGGEFIYVSHDEAEVLFDKEVINGQNIRLKEKLPVTLSN